MTLLVAQLGFSPRTSAPARSSTSTRGASQSFGLLTIWVTERIFVVRDRFQVFLGCHHSNSSSCPVKGEDQQWTLAVPTCVLELFRLSCAPATPKVHLTISEALLRGFISHLTSLVVTLQGYIFPARHPVLRSPRFLGRILPLGSQSPLLSFFNAWVDFGLYCLTSLAEESCQDPRVSFKSD